jgi:hypothetical protein
MILEKYKNLPKLHAHKVKEESRYGSYYAIIFFLIILGLACERNLCGL